MTEQKVFSATSPSWPAAKLHAKRGKTLTTHMSTRTNTATRTSIKTQFPAPCIRLCPGAVRRKLTTMSTLALELTTMTPKPPTQTEPSGKDLAQRTVFIRVSFGLIGNSRKVPNSAVEVDTDKDLIRVNKTLLDSKELKAIKSADSDLR